MFQNTIISNPDITNISLTDGTFRCYILLQSVCYGKKDVCFPSQKYIAISLGRSVRTIQRYLKELIKNNLIIKRRRGSISNEYKLLQKKAMQALMKAKAAYENNKKNNKSNSKKFSKPSKKNKLGFCDYEQRNYNFENLEAMFRGEMDYDPSLLENDE